MLLKTTSVSPPDQQIVGRPDVCLVASANLLSLNYDRYACFIVLLWEAQSSLVASLIPEGLGRNSFGSEISNQISLMGDSSLTFCSVDLGNVLWLPGRKKKNKKTTLCLD